MGCRPLWDHASGRVTGVEVLPTAAMGRARVDVTWRISGLFRDLFPAQIALLDAAVQAVAARDETADENPLAQARRASGAARLDRIFGTAPGAYGSGIEDLLGRETDTATHRRRLSRGHLACLWRRRRRRQRCIGRFRAARCIGRPSGPSERRSGARSSGRRGRRSLRRRLRRRRQKCSAAPPISSCST